MERFVMPSQFQLIVFLLYYKVLKYLSLSQAVIVSRIARDDKVKPQSKPEKVSV